MFRRGIIAIIVLAALSCIMIAAFAFSDDNSKPINQQSISNNSNLNQVSNSTINNVLVTKKNSNMVNNLLTPQEAKLISEKYINQTGVIPGTPALVNEGGKKVYVVPVLDNKTIVGEIHIDAHSGKNLGGAGGIKQ
jgi:uncharacterized membrane protein affecting hemolysin expression